MRKIFIIGAKKPNLMSLTAVVLILLSSALFIFLLLLQIIDLKIWYDKYQILLDNLEFRVAALNGKWVIVVSVFLLFSLKAVLPIPIFPISCVCVISSMVFSPLISLAINVAGFMFLFAIRYHIGEGEKSLPYKFLKTYDEIRDFLKLDSNGNPWVLLIARLIPLFPINTVSSVYGGIKYKFNKYLYISLLGFMPKILTYTIIGRNAFNPFSASFIVPLMFSFLFSGVGLLIMRKLILIIRKKGEEDVKNKN
ncbi:MAG: TVP38/TMEM64 family protein [Ruminococcaceae bacterium]|nr:TVP38/TMEM64 family protein [Oscillospiraceae bacterium]